MCLLNKALIYVSVYVFLTYYNNNNNNNNNDDNNKNNS